MWSELTRPSFDHDETNISGGKEFALQNSGDSSCAASYQGGFVMMGGHPGHGKVDRWEKTVRSESPFPSQIRLGRQISQFSTRPSGRKISSRLHHVHIFRRRRGLIPKYALVLIIIPRACWSLEVTMVVIISQAPSCSCRQGSSGPKEKIFPGILKPNLNHHHHFDGDQSLQSCWLPYSQLLWRLWSLILSAVFHISTKVRYVESLFWNIRGLAQWCSAWYWKAV